MKSSKKNKRRANGSKIFLLMVGFGLFLSHNIVLGQSKANPGGNIKAGKALFQKTCAVCHGDKAQGEDKTQPMGGTKDNGIYLAPALNGTGHTWHHPTGMLFNTIKNGSMAQESPMKGFGKTLTDEEIMNVLRYVKSLWPERIQTMHTKRDKMIEKQNSQ